MTALPALSYSSYRTYAECPLRWKYLYVDHLPEAPRGYFTFGRVIHSALEELVRPLVVPSARRIGEAESQRTLDEWGTAPRKAEERRWLTLEELLGAYDRLWLSDGYTSPEEEARYRDLGRDLLRRFYDQLARERPSPVSVEEHLEARWDGIPVHGYIDRIDRTAAGGLEVVDYKTTRDLSGEDARDSDQLSLYQVLVERNYAEPVAGLTLYHLRSQTPIRVPPRARPTLQLLHERMGEVIDGIRADVFEPTPGRQCSRCDFRPICPEFKPVPAADEARMRLLVDRFESLRADEHRLEQELRRTAEELHHAAEELGVHRIPGSRSTAIRRKEEAWQYTLDPVRPLLEESGLSARVASGRPEDVRRLVRDPSVNPELRRKISETGARRVKWFWELEGANGAA
jgi:putative RecB family exonuclease